MKKRISLVVIASLFPFMCIADPVTVVNLEGVKITFEAERADTRQLRQKGLMFRTNLYPHQGMLLVYPRPTAVQMWMKNTPISLDMIFVDRSGVVRKVYEDTLPYSTAIIGPVPKTQAVLEVPAGTCRKYGIVPGSRLLSSSV